MDDVTGSSHGCCETAHGCVFAKALLAHTAICERVHRRSIGERDLLECSSPEARIDCGALAALLHERARFVLRLPPPSRPLTHVQGLRLQCGGLAALRRELDPTEPDVQRIVALAMERHGSLGQLPWGPVVAALAEWRPRRRARPRY
jgi:hypothetical protein